MKTKQFFLIATLIITATSGNVTVASQRGQERDQCHICRVSFFHQNYCKHTRLCEKRNYPATLTQKQLSGAISKQRARRRRPVPLVRQESVAARVARRVEKNLRQEEALRRKKSSRPQKNLSGIDEMGIKHQSFQGNPLDCVLNPPQIGPTPPIKILTEVLNEQTSAYQQAAGLTPAQRAIWLQQRAAECREKVAQCQELSAQFEGKSEHWKQHFDRPRTINYLEKAFLYGYRGSLYQSEQLALQCLH